MSLEMREVVRWRSKLAITKYGQHAKPHNFDDTREWKIYKERSPRLCLEALQNLRVGSKKEPARETHKKQLVKQEENQFSCSYDEQREKTASRRIE